MSPVQDPKWLHVTKTAKEGKSIKITTFRFAELHFFFFPTQVTTPHIRLVPSRLKTKIPNSIKTICTLSRLIPARTLTFNVVSLHCCTGTFSLSKQPAQCFCLLTTVAAKYQDTDTHTHTHTPLTSPQRRALCFSDDSQPEEGVQPVKSHHVKGSHVSLMTKVTQ